MDIIKKLLEARGFKTKKDVQEFFHPTQPKDLITPFDTKPAIRLIESHIKKNHKIAVYGDYDVDGICSTAIVWETLYKNYQNVFPHIPHRELEGYGLSKLGIDHCLEKGAKLIIAVDNGIVAYDQIQYCRDQGCDIIIIDHHELGEKLPKANCVLHSTSCCAAALAWFFCRDYLALNTEHLTLVAIATICDMVPLLGPNRSFAKYGLEELRRTTRPGLKALFEEAAIKPENIETYEVGFIIGPRLNAAGRLEHAIDSLRLLCTKDSQKAYDLAQSLGQTNKARQEATAQAVSHALSVISETNIIVVANATYHPGIIGLIAAKLVEKYHRPAIAISIGEKQSKGSARSVPGFHITEHLRSAGDLLLGVGGHMMAAGFTVENSNLETLISKISDVKIDPELLIKKQRVDLEIPLSVVDYELLNQLKEFEPYGLGNPQPIFLSKNILVSNIRKLGKLGQHLKFQAGDFEAIWFNPSNDLNLEQKNYNVIYQIEENIWNGQSKLQLVIKDVRPVDQ